MTNADWQVTAPQSGPVAFGSAPEPGWTLLQPGLFVLDPPHIAQVVRVTAGTGTDRHEIIVDIEIEGLSVTRTVRGGQQAHLARPDVLSRSIAHLHDAADALNDILIAPFTAHLDAMKAVHAGARRPSHRLWQLPRQASHSSLRAWRRDVIARLNHDRERLLDEADFGVDVDLVPTELQAFARRFARIARPYPVKWTARTGSSVFEFSVTLPQCSHGGLVAATVSKDARLFLEERPMPRQAHPIAAAQLVAAARLARLGSRANLTFVGEGYLDGESDPVARVEITPKAWAEEFGQALRLPLRSAEAFQGQFMELVY